jgi:acetoin utilization protein AcuB
MKVKEIMTARPLKYCSPETKLHNAAKTMKIANCGALPVINKDKIVVGFITDRDIALTLARKQEKSVAQMEVSKAMSLKVHTVKAEDDVSTALRQMRTYQVGRVPVVDGKGKLKGIVSMHNLISQSGSVKSKVDVGTLASPRENLLRTMHAITNRYSNGGKKTK